LTRYVVDAPTPIKGGSTLEYVIGGGAMAGCLGAVAFDALDLATKGLDPCRQFIERQGAEVLLYRQGKRVLRFRGKEVVEIHGPALTGAAPKSISLRDDTRAQGQ